jgi:hypothetical protein
MDSQNNCCFCDNRLSGTIVFMIKEVILGFVGARGILIDRYVREKDINSILHVLRPVNSGHEMIRIGSYNDGGYLVPNVLDGISACFSPGVATNSSFEWQLAEMGIECFLADNSVEGPPQNHTKFNFIKKHLGSVSSPTMITLSAWLTQNYTAGDLLLQMDIEGSEYAVIASTSLEELNRFRVIILELHEFDSIVTVIGNLTIKNILNQLLQNHSVVHVHANNFGIPRKFKNKYLPRGIEITLLRNDFIVGTGHVTELPNTLDQRNSLLYPELPLDHKWFS